MDIVRIGSIDEPFTTPEVGEAASILLGRAESMGLLDHMGTISHLDAEVVDTVLRRLGRLGLVQHAIIEGGIAALSRDDARLLRVLREANAALEYSPIPSQEWAALRETLGDGLLARLCRISEASLRRYATGARSTPDPIAERLHVLALIVADLRGAYNDYGVRRWFQRPRPQLGGRSPEEALPLNWTADSAEAGQLRALAGALVSSPAT